MPAPESPKLFPMRRTFEHVVAFHNATERKGEAPRVLVRGFLVLETTDGVEEYVELHPSEDLRGWEFAGLHAWVSDMVTEVEERRKEYP